MKILIVIGTVSGRGGIETCIRTVAIEAAKRGDSIRIFALCPSTKDDFWHKGLDYKELASSQTSLSKQALLGLPAMVKEIASSKPDVILTIYSSTIPFVRLALLLLAKSVPVIAWLHFSAALKQKTSLLRYAQGALCISREITESVEKIRGIDPKRVFLVYNGIDTHAAQPVPRSQDGKFRIVYVGRVMIGKQKQTDLLLSALSTVEGNWSLEIVGDGEDAPALKAMTRDLGLEERIVWHGWKSNPWQEPAQADLLILCSKFEGFPMALVEAIARGIPCISSDCPSGPSDIVQDGVNGWLYPVDAPAELARILARVIAHPELLPSTEQVRATAMRFDSTAVYGRIRKALEEILANKKRI